MTTPKKDQEPKPEQSSLLDLNGDSQGPSWEGDGLKPIATTPTEYAKENLVAELRGWWEATTSADFEQMAPKIAEYTASDLTLMGRFLEEWTAMPEGTGPEAACAFYLLGKIARAVAAYKDGRLPSDDTLHDIVIYAMMMRRIREKGGWPS